MILKSLDIIVEPLNNNLWKNHFKILNINKIYLTKCELSNDIKKS